MTSSLWRRAAATKRLVRVVLAAGLATIVAAPIVAGSADAKGKPADVTLTCANGENVSGVIELLSAPTTGSPASAQVPISCTPGQTSKVAIHPTSQPAPAFEYQLTDNGLPEAFFGGLRGMGPIALTGGGTLTVT
jgi:hypothetical protein